jgi:hypothetical protein
MTDGGSASSAAEDTAVLMDSLAALAHHPEGTGWGRVTHDVACEPVAMAVRRRAIGGVALVVVAAAVVAGVVVVTAGDDAS